ncbi:hypothetical protein CYMTET_52170 [Cymbomonas tetramitiformis]|uniref:Uncharacterized protein n=1 Tax=Cymbomonas tetramitiformis TaxID=36881 RepID=A0AAE0BLD7_9CHLO|nr:hypothetical protein CYMTET_52170 [Cymbomonas tetramitiformis]
MRSEVLVHVMDGGYGSVEGFDWEESPDDHEPNKQPSFPITEDNVQRAADSFVQLVACLPTASYSSKLVFCALPTGSFPRVFHRRTTSW